jgi:late competence protein required for DNA uptake (superfamily II DNA/RNA helicase)
MVSTTVVEVGVNVPNATVMVIESRKIWSIAIASVEGKGGKKRA